MEKRGTSVMNGLFVSFLLASFISVMAHASTTKDSTIGFHEQMNSRLIQLNSELGQLKRKLDKVSDEQKTGLQSSIEKLSSKWTQLDQRVRGLKPKPTESDKKLLKTQIASLEKEFDVTEDTYKEHGVGLGDILGF